jgi:molecular chaperone IbpA
MNDFERLMDELFGRPGGGFPFYDVLRVDRTHYVITLAVAGFSRDDLHVTQAGRFLQVSGKRNNKARGNDLDDPYTVYLHRGITRQEFRKEFELSPNMEVSSVVHENGELSIYLEHQVPEKEKPRQLTIQSQ